MEAWETIMALDLFMGAPEPMAPPSTPAPSPKGRREKPVRHPGSTAVIPGTASVIPNLIGNPLYGGCGVLGRHGSPLSRG